MRFLNPTARSGGTDIVFPVPERDSWDSSLHTHAQYLSAAEVQAGPGVTVETFDDGVVVISAAPTGADSHYVREDAPVPVDSDHELALNGVPPIEPWWGSFWGADRWQASFEADHVSLAQAAAGSVLLDSARLIAVVPGDRFEVTVELTPLSGSGALRAVPQLFLTTTVDDYFGPFDPQTQTLSPAWTSLVPGTPATLTWTVTVPDTISPSEGPGEPVLGRFGVFLDQADAVDGIVLVRSVRVLRVSDTFPMGAIWLNPAMLYARTSLWMQWASAVWRLSDSLTNAAKVLAGSRVLRLEIPVDGELVVDAIGRIRNVTGQGTGGARYRIAPVLVSGDTWTGLASDGGRFFTDGGFTGRLEYAAPFLTRMMVKAGSVVDLVLNFYADADTQAQRHELYAVQGRVEFTPLMLEPNQVSDAAELRWWDGTEWSVRRALESETYDAGSTPAKLNTTTALARTPSKGTAGKTIFTLTATVSPPSGGQPTPTGSVSFQHRRQGDTGFTTFATVTLKNGVAVHKRGWSMKGTHRLRVLYNGSGTHNKSTSAETTVVLS